MNISARQPGKQRPGCPRKDASRWGFSLAFGFLFPLKSRVSASGGQVSSSLQIPGHSQSARTADHYHHRRSQSSGTGSGGTCGACGSPGSSRPRSWGCSLRRLEADTVLGSLGGTWGRGIWEGAGTAAGSAGRTSRQEVSEPGEMKSPCQPGIHSPVFPHSWFPDPSLVRPAAS